MDLISDLKKAVSGEVLADKPTLSLYSHDTSLFEITPQVVVYPRDIADIKALVRFVTDHKKELPALSLTGRSGGTDMSGGAINDSVIIDFSKHIHHMGEVDPEKTTAEPGVFYRDFERKTLKHRLYLPSYPASKNICAIGGMVNNNSGGEKSLIFGKTIDYVVKLKVVLSDGEEYILRRINKNELDEKMTQTDFEGEVYRKVYKLIENNYDLIKNAKPKVSKNSTGYNLWDVWDREYFDLTKLFVGSQGTLGLVTEATFKLVEAKKFSGLLVVYVDDLRILPSIINDVVATKPDSFEAFDDHTLSLAIKFIPQFMYILGLFKTIQMGLQFLPDLLQFMVKGLPKYTLLVEYEGDSQEEVTQKIQSLHQVLGNYHLKIEEAKDKSRAENYWAIRRESFNLLRKNVKNKHTAPFIDDFIVPPDRLIEFLPKLIIILEKYELQYTIAGHMGNGNFHIIPLMDLREESEREKIPIVAELVNKLVLEYKGSLSAEHNDGLIRGPYIEMMYGEKMFNIFKEVKEIFDPEKIFNPHKKTDANLQYSLRHIRDHF